MKSQALRKAWELFRKYKMTFSQALIEGWKFAKREALKLEFTTTNFADSEKRNELVKKFNYLKETIYLPIHANPIPQRTVVNLNLEGRYESWMQ